MTGYCAWAERAQCTVHVLQAGRWLMNGVRRGREFTWGDDPGWLSWRWCWWLCSVALRWRWRWNPVKAAVLSLCRDTDRFLFPRWFYPFYPFSSFSPTVSLSLPVDIPSLFLVSTVSIGFSLSWSVSLSFGFSPRLLPFFFSFFSLAFRWYL